MKLGDDNLGWVDVDWDGGTVGLLLGELLNLDGELESVHGGNSTLRTLLGTSDNEDLVVLSDWKSSDTVLLSKLLGEWGRKHHSSLGRWSGEVGLSGLGSVGGHV